MSNSIFKEFSDSITSYQDTGITIKEKVNHSSDNSSSSRCLNCKRPLVNTNFSPFCGAICLGAWNSERAKDVKGSNKNILLGFSKVFEQ